MKPNYRKSIRESKDVTNTRPVHIKERSNFERKCHVYRKIRFFRGKYHNYYRVVEWYDEYSDEILSVDVVTMNVPGRNFNDYASQPISGGICVDTRDMIELILACIEYRFQDIGPDAFIITE